MEKDFGNNFCFDSILNSIYYFNFIPSLFEAKDYYNIIYPIMYYAKFSYCLIIQATDRYSLILFFVISFIFTSLLFNR